LKALLEREVASATTGKGYLSPEEEADKNAATSSDDTSPDDATADTADPEASTLASDAL